MMRNNKRIIICLAVLALLASLLTVGAAADRDDWVWTVTRDAETVSNGEDSWSYFWFPKGTIVAPEEYYCLGDTELYASDVDIEMGKPYGLTPDGGDLTEQDLIILNIRHKTEH